MPEAFRFTLTDEEKTFLKTLVRDTIQDRLDDRPRPSGLAPPTDRLREPLGAFVTLKIRGRLRGCIGNIQGGRPLFQTIQDMALSAAFQDPRFPPLTAPEFRDTEVEISILSPVEACPDPEQVEVGRHGLIMVRGGRSGLLLPQVPVEWKWDRPTFLDQTCRKAGMEPGCWRDPGTAIYWFQAEVF